MYLLPGSTKRFYSRLRAISVHISPEIYSQANIRDPGGGFKRQVLLLLKGGVIDSPQTPTSLLLVAGRWQHGLGFSLENCLRSWSVMPVPRGCLVAIQGWALFFREPCEEGVWGGAVV